MALEYKKVCKMIALFIIIIGVLVMALGFEALIIGNAGQKRYENSSGTLVRLFSEKDSTYYDTVKSLKNFGWIASFTGLIIIAAGIAFTLKPEWCMSFLRKTRLEEKLLE